MLIQNQAILKIIKNTIVIDVELKILYLNKIAKKLNINNIIFNKHKKFLIEN